MIYRVLDKQTNEIKFESTNLKECYKYIDDNCCFSSTIIRKAIA